jgi:hypothetical protein
MIQETKKLFYAAKSVEPTLTAKKIAETLNTAGIMQQKKYTQHMVSNMINGKSYDENIYKVLIGVAKNKINEVIK